MALRPRSILMASVAHRRARALSAVGHRRAGRARHGRGGCSLAATSHNVHALSPAIEWWHCHHRQVLTFSAKANSSMQIYKITGKLLAICFDKCSSMSKKHPAKDLTIRCRQSSSWSNTTHCRCFHFSLLLHWRRPAGPRDKRETAVDTVQTFLTQRRMTSCMHDQRFKMTKDLKVGAVHRIASSDVRRT